MVLCILLWAVSRNCAAQTMNLRVADSLLFELQDVRAADKLTQIFLCDSLDAFYASEGDECKRIQILARKADIWDRNFMLDDALAAVLLGIEQFGPQCDTAVLVELMAVRSNIALSLEHFERADSICQVGLTWWSPEGNDHRFRFSLLNNMAYCCFYTDRLEKGVQLTRKIYLESLASGDTAFAMMAAGNLGAMKAAELGFDSAEYFIDQQLAWAIKENDIRAMAQLFNNLAGVISEKGDHQRAIDLLDSGFVLSQNYGELSSQTELKRNMASVYAKMGAFESAYAHLEIYDLLRDSVLGRDKLKAVLDIEERFEQEKTARQMEVLKVAQLDSELENERLIRGRNINIFITVCVVLVAGGLFSRLRHTRRTKSSLQKEKDRSDELLLNILPENVAKELKETGHAEARHFEEITVFFSDILGFTEISERLTPAELVAEVHYCFKTFDKVMIKYGIEKIKTIGDAYMAAGGLNTDNTNTAKQVVRAALELQDFMNAERLKRKLEGRPYFEMRVGIHSGPVVAGIVGDSKFQYDIWGDTVNTAARVESCGAVGKVNISQSTRDLLQLEDDLQFEARGKVKAKGKGEIEMFYVSLMEESDPPATDTSEIINAGVSYSVPGVHEAQPKNA